MQLCESASSQDPIQAKAEIQEITNRIQGYLQTAGPCTQIPIAEAMVNYKDEDSCQIFVPFVCVSKTPLKLIILMFSISFIHSFVRSVCRM